MASYSQSLITKPSGMSKYMRVWLGFDASTLRIHIFGLMDWYFTLLYSTTLKHCKPNHMKEEKEVEVSEHVAHIVVDDYEDDPCIASNQHQEDYVYEHVSTSSFHSKDDGCI